MRARAKINLFLVVVAAVVIELFALISTPFLESLARTDVLQKARIMMEAASGIRTYTSSEIAPLLGADPDDSRFHPQTVPSYAATRNFALLAAKFANYAYREAALNPINPLNRAFDWEADIITDFRRHADKPELITERETHSGRVLHLSRPIVVSRTSCLSCHGTPDKAPKAMIAAYGAHNGFGWKLDEVVGAQIVSVPMAVALDHATRIRNMFIGVLSGVFLLLIGLFNVLPLMTAGSRPEAGPGETVPSPSSAPIKAFGHGLLAAGVVLVLIVYVVIYAKEGMAGVARALDPFALANYASVLAVAPGIITIWLSERLTRVRGLRPARQRWSPAKAE